jgi:hypothetical protein
MSEPPAGTATFPHQRQGPAAWQQTCRTPWLRYPGADTPLRERKDLLQRCCA